MPEIEGYIEPLMVEIGGVYSYLHVEVTAPPDPQKCMFLIHDLAGRSDDFAPLAPHLARLGYKVVMIDLPGRGKSAAVEEASYTLRMYVEVLFALLKEHGLKQNAALGQGWGAMIALLFESFLARPLQHMYLVDLPAHWSYATDPAAQTWAALAPICTETPEDFLAQAENAVPQDLAGRDALLTLAAERGRIVEGNHQLALDPAIFANLSKSETKVYNLESALNKLRSPTQLLQGAQSAVPLVTSAFVAQRHLSGKVGHAQIIRGSHTSWTDPALLLPVLGAVCVGGQSAPS
ncbi:pimeloyl-ACP methyl ester carboxylesterase [Yoonia maricola]|uniref:Pimeloyl-ACP methyl ester carboxylesterase n=1 Tax=Yoonia maricola TaxID=420999 RepID=A0A2M8WQ50_9RHOB|nr:alpha/beta fold hydrolase [Yoonia maricola]PJI93060.1 pimeloyl-ACP methyl ester carboxylesterase [Yoonia maricola]